MLDSILSILNFLDDRINNDSHRNQNPTDKQRCVGLEMREKRRNQEKYAEQYQNEACVFQEIFHDD